MSNISVIDPPFLVVLGVLTSVAIAVSWLRPHRRAARWGVRALAVTLALLTTAAAVNARYAYLPTISALLGRTAIDQVSAGQLRRLELATGSTSAGLRAERDGRAHPAEATARRGVVVAFAIPGRASHFHARVGAVYLPPAYFASPRPQLPVVELLHGTPGSPADWTRAVFADVTADAWASRHDGLAPILVMPDVNGAWASDSECVNGRRGNAQTYLTVDVRNAVVARFHSRADGAGWSIAGLSEGGMCALQIGLRHPSMFRAIGDFSGDARPSVPGGVQRLFSGTPARAREQLAAYDPLQLLRRWRAPRRPAIWFEVGTRDGNLGALVRLDLAARAAGFATHFVAQPGETHGFAAWRSAFAQYLPWVAALLTGSPAAGRTEGA